MCIRDRRLDLLALAPELRPGGHLVDGLVDGLAQRDLRDGVVHGDEPPHLGVAGVGGAHRQLDHRRHVLPWDGVGEEAANAGAAADGALEPRLGELSSGGVGVHARDGTRTRQRRGGRLAAPAPGSIICACVENALQPPEMGGTTESMSPSFSGVSRPPSALMLRAFRNTPAHILPSSRKMRCLSRGSAAMARSSASATVVASHSICRSPPAVVMPTGSLT